MIAGRSEDGVRQAVASLGRHGNVEGERCDVTSTTELQALWDSAHSRWGQIDHWINNAGMATAGIHLDELAPEQIEAVVATNLIGALLGAHVAIAGMRSQGHGQLLFMEGFGSDNMVMPGMTAYGATKRALVYAARSLQRELRGSGVLVATLSPGMVATDMLREQIAATPAERRGRTERVLNILADPVAPVAKHLVRHLRANRRSGARIRWVTRAGLFVRFLRPSYRRRDLFASG